MKKLLLIAALFISLNGFAQKTTLHKMTSVNANNLKEIRAIPVSYTHLTLPTNREV